ncbi:RHS repeat domain-containing protein [Diaphorobacter caeni]|uniref:RHS repeat domain-containing protein n=1 Tax=Diaphorobacter caeni TaxID=2784387 RepID=UPI002B269357|nr:RHS repeat domain-containing protein [Diaphorobacter caeni]
MQRGYVRDNLVWVFEDKRYFYDGHARLIRKLSGKHTDQSFVWDEENNLVEVTTTRRPGTENATTQTTRFDYDAIGRRVAKHDSFGKTVFIWKGMRLIEERRGSAIISYVYEPDSYVPLARLDVDGESTEQGGLGTTDDPALGEIETGNGPTTAAPSGLQPPAANDSLEAQYWQALSPSPNAARKTGADDYARLCNVYYFHTDQVGMPPGTGQRSRSGDLAGQLQDMGFHSIGGVGS